MIVETPPSYSSLKLHLYPAAARTLAPCCMGPTGQKSNSILNNMSIQLLHTQWTFKSITLYLTLYGWQCGWSGPEQDILPTPGQIAIKRGMEIQCPQMMNSNVIGQHPSLSSNATIGPKFALVPKSNMLTALIRFVLLRGCSLSFLDTMTA